MKHQISTTTTNDEWEQVMTCEFIGDAITELVWKDIPKCRRKYKDCLLVDGEGKAELQREGKTITATCKKQERYTRNWDADPNANQEALEALAQEWEQQEKKWLPISRYFNACTKDAMNAWAQKWTDHLLDLEHEAKIERLKRKGDIKFCEAQNKERHLTYLERGRRLNDIEEALSLHRDLPFHFMDRKGGEK